MSLMHESSEEHYQRTLRENAQDWKHKYEQERVAHAATREELRPYLEGEAVEAERADKLFAYKSRVNALLNDRERMTALLEGAHGRADLHWRSETDGALHMNRFYDLLWQQIVPAIRAALDGENG